MTRWGTVEGKTIGSPDPRLEEFEECSEGPFQHTSADVKGGREGEKGLVGNVASIGIRNERKGSIPNAKDMFFDSKSDIRTMKRTNVILALSPGFWNRGNWPRVVEEAVAEGSLGSKRFGLHGRCPAVCGWREPGGYVLAIVRPDGVGITRGESKKDRSVECREESDERLLETETGCPLF
ncbi:hypothetical protein BC826DRAFT_970858 [Russula brevipes]|nr:hypothetical protein BC826DRAFT_970858 [Russula brevipes]